MKEDMYFVLLSNKFHFGGHKGMFCGISENFRDVSLVKIIKGEKIRLDGDVSIDYPIQKREVCARCLKQIEHYFL